MGPYDRTTSSARKKAWKSQILHSFGSISIDPHRNRRFCVVVLLCSIYIERIGHIVLPIKRKYTTKTNSHEVYVDQMQFDAASDEDNHGANRGGRRMNRNNNRNGAKNGGNGELNTAAGAWVYEDDTDHPESNLSVTQI